METYRVICTKNPSGTIVDFATANNAGDSIITHASLLKLRQYETPGSENILPPLFLQDDNGNIKLYLDKPEKASETDKALLDEMTSRIKSTYNKMKTHGQKNTLELTDKNFALFYDKLIEKPQTPEQYKYNREVEYSQRRLHTAEMKRKLYEEKPFIPPWQRYSGD